MSPVPARPVSPERCSSASDSSAAGTPRCSMQPQQEAGVDAARPRGHHEAVERREAHRRVDRAPAGDRAQRRARAEVAGDDPRRAGRAAPRRAARRRRARGRGSRTGAAQRSATRSGSAYVAAAAASVAWNAVSKHATAGRTAPRARRSPPAHAAGAAARGRSAPRAARAPARRSRPAAGSPSPPCTMRCPTASASGRPSSASAGDRRVARRTRARARRPCDRRRPSTRSLRLLEPALTTRSRTRSARPGPVAHVGRVVAVLARVGAVAQPLVDHRPGAGAAARAPRPGTRSITSMTRWKRSRSLSMTMSNGVVVVPSSL